jgi:eukaryotic-like serine/threonine-protein kinase
VGESDFSTLEKVRNVEILPPSSFNKRIAPELERIVLKTLAKEVEDRYQNAIDLHDDLQAYLYSIGEFYSRKDLAGWMKKAFAAELEEEKARNAQWEQLEQPTPPPAPEATRQAEGRATAPGALDWDDEELETQIFDRPGESGRDERDAELSSSDILLQDGGLENLDDKTAIAPPPDAAALAMEMDYAIQSAPASAYGAGPGSTYAPQGSPFGGGSGGASGPGAGPPPGLSAYRQSGSHATVSRPGAAGATNPWGFSPVGQQRADGNAGAPAPVSPFRQTIMGLPQLQAPSYAAGAGAAATGGFRDRRSAALPGARRIPVKTLATAGALLVAGFVLYNIFWRPARLAIDVIPADAVVQLEGVVLRGPAPIKLEKPPGHYNLAFSKEGYAKHEQTVQLKGGEEERVRVHLEASPDTGFELTSDPPGQLVWLDGQPFTGSDPNNPQARTDLRASRVPPGPHVLEIKGDNRFKPWKLDFYQEPARMMPIRATLQPDTARAGTAGPGGDRPAPTPPVAVRPPEPVPSPAPTTPAAAPQAPAPAPRPDPPPQVAVKPAPPPPPAQPPPQPQAPPTPAPPAPREPAPRPAPPPAVAESPAATPPAAAPAATRDRGVCLVTIGSRPWAEVWVDGRNTGKLTPLVGHKVACGRRKIRLWNPELNLEKTENVILRSSEPFKKIFQLDDPQ